MYLAPLVDDLKILWNDDVEMYDAYRLEALTLKAMLLWKINDFLLMGTCVVVLLKVILLVRYVGKEHLQKFESIVERCHLQVIEDSYQDIILIGNKK